MKYNSSLLILLFALINLSSCSEDESSLMNIIQASGTLYEKKSQQDITVVFSKTKINPLGIKQVILKNEEEMAIYPTQINCDYKLLILYNYAYATCKIDLTNVPSGFYRIILLLYNNMHYKINSMVPFLVQQVDSEDLSNELINVLADNITEYSLYQDIELLFSKKIEFKGIRGMDIVNNRYEHFDVNLDCYFRKNANTASCVGDFDGIKAGKYLINKVYYGNDISYHSREVYITVQAKNESELDLVNISLIIYQGWSSLNLTFNQQVYAQNFGRMELFNKTQIYNNNFNPSVIQFNQTTIMVEVGFSIDEGIYCLGMSYEKNWYDFENICINVIDNRYPPKDGKNTIYSLIRPKKMKN